MIYLGYIYTKLKLKNIPYFIKIVSSYKEIEDVNKPLLIIGLKEAKKHITSFSILKKQYNDMMFWTFSKTEKRNDFEKDIVNFLQFVINVSLNNIKYTYINIFKLKYNKIIDLFKLLYSINIYKYIYINNNMIYILYNNNIIGFSKNILEYCDINYNKILNRMKNYKTNIFVEEYICENIYLNKQLNENEYIKVYISSLNKN